MPRMGVLVSGGRANLQTILDAVDHGDITNAEASVVISNSPGAYALGRTRKYGIRAVCISPKQFPTRDASSQAFLAKIDEYDLDLIVPAGFLVVVLTAMTEKYKGRIINTHSSLTPSFCGVGYYGLKVHEAALARGVKVTGATVHYVDGGIDTGPIILQKAVRVEEGDTPEILQRRVMEQVEQAILSKTISMIANGQ